MIAALAASMGLIGPVGPGEPAWQAECRAKEEREDQRFVDESAFAYWGKVSRIKTDKTSSEPFNDSAEGRFWLEPKIVLKGPLPRRLPSARWASSIADDGTGFDYRPEIGEVYLVLVSRFGEVTAIVLVC